MHVRRSVAVLVAAGLVALPASPALGRPAAPAYGVVAATGSVGGETSADRSRDGGTTSTTFAVLVGGLVGAFFLIGLAFLPATATPRFARARVDRVDVLLAGALALLGVTLFYFVSVLWT